MWQWLTQWKKICMYIYISLSLYIYIHIHISKTLMRFCRKWNKTSWFILLQTDKAWLPLIVLQQLCHCAAISTSAEVSEIRISWSSRQLTRQLWCCKGGYGFWLFLQGKMRSVPVNVRTLFTPQSSHLCHHFSPHHAESCLVWSSFWVSLILSGLTMKANLLCSSQQWNQPTAHPIQTGPKIPPESIIISTRDFWMYQTFSSKSTDLHSFLP